MQATRIRPETGAMDRRRLAAATLSAVLPGLGQAFNRRRRLTLLFLIPSLIVVAIVVVVVPILLYVPVLTNVDCAPLKSLEIWASTDVWS